MREFLGLKNFLNTQKLFSHQIEISYQSEFLIKAYEFKERQFFLRKFKNQLKLIKNTLNDDDIHFTEEAIQEVFIYIKSF